MYHFIGHGNTSCETIGIHAGYVRYGIDWTSAFCLEDNDTIFSCASPDSLQHKSRVYSGGPCCNPHRCQICSATSIQCGHPDHLKSTIQLRNMSADISTYCTFSLPFLILSIPQEGWVATLTHYSTSFGIPMCKSVSIQIEISLAFALKTGTYSSASLKALKTFFFSV